MGDARCITQQVQASNSRTKPPRFQLGVIASTRPHRSCRLPVPKKLSPIIRSDTDDRLDEPRELPPDIDTDTDTRLRILVGMASTHPRGFDVAPEELIDSTPSLLTFTPVDVGQRLDVHPAVPLASEADAFDRGRDGQLSDTNFAPSLMRQSLDSAASKDGGPVGSWVPSWLTVCSSRRPCSEVPRIYSGEGHPALAVLIADDKCSPPTVIRLKIRRTRPQ